MAKRKKRMTLHYQDPVDPTSMLCGASLENHDRTINSVGISCPACRAEWMRRQKPTGAAVKCAQPIYPDRACDKSRHDPIHPDGAYLFDCGGEIGDHIPHAFRADQQVVKS